MSVHYCSEVWAKLLIHINRGKDSINPRCLRVLETWKRPPSLQDWKVKTGFAGGYVLRAGPGMGYARGDLPSSIGEAPGVKIASVPGEATAWDDVGSMTR